MSSEARSSTATNGKDPPRNNNKKNSSPAIEPISISSLPHDLLLNCLARVSRLDYPMLSIVSKNFRSIIASSELYETRSRLNRTEKCLYLCLHFSFNPNTLWFTIRRQPNRTIANKSSGYRIVRIPSPNHLLPVKSSSLVAVGSNIYKIGCSDDAYGCNFFERPYSSSVSVLDCRSHTWHQAPSMSMKRNSSSTASLVDGKIYVAGGCEDKYLSYLNWIEVFDSKTQTWSSNPHIFELHHGFWTRSYVAKSLGLEGKLYMFGDDNEVYNPKEDRLNAIGVDWPMSWAVRYCHCVIDDVLFYWNKGVFKWYDFKVSFWKELKGVEGLPDFRDHEICEMVDLGGKMAVLWEEDEYTQNCKEVSIWCAEIALERRDGDEIWGKVELFDVLLIVPLPDDDDGMYTSFDALSASV